MDYETSVHTEPELGNTLTYYYNEGYRLNGHYNNKLVLAKNGYSTTLLIILLLLGIIFGVIYYAINKNKHKIIISLEFENYNDAIEKAKYGDKKVRNSEIKLAITMLIVFTTIFTILIMIVNNQ